MPQFPFTATLSANQRNFDPLSSWQYRYLPWPAHVKLLMRATVVAPASQVLATVYSGSETIMQRAPVQNGGAAGVTPAELTTAPIEWVAGAGDVLLLQIDEGSNVATSVIDGLIIVNPVV